MLFELLKKNRTIVFTTFWLNHNFNTIDYNFFYMIHYWGYSQSSVASWGFFFTIIILLMYPIYNVNEARIRYKGVRCDSVSTGCSSAVWLASKGLKMRRRTSKLFKSLFFAKNKIENYSTARLIFLSVSIIYFFF